MQRHDSTVLSIGADAGDLIDAGVAILFARPVPDALAEVSIVHSGFDVGEDAVLVPGAVIEIGESRVVAEQVGDLAEANLRELGHIVLYCDVDDDQALLPGAVFARGQITAPAAGDRISISAREA